MGGRAPDGASPEQSLQQVDGVGHGGRITRTVADEYTVRLEIEDLLGVPGRRDDADLATDVHEMAQDILGVEDVRKSIADFEPGSLTAVARQAMETQVMDSPHPSPNAARGAQGAAAVAAAAAQRRRDPQEVLDAKAFSDRLAGRMEKVAARAGRGRGVPQDFMPVQDGWDPDSDTPLRPPTRRARFLGFVVSMIVALGLSLGARPRGSYTKHHADPYLHACLRWSIQMTVKNSASTTKVHSDGTATYYT